MFFLAIPLISAAVSAISTSTAVAAGTAVCAAGYALGRSCAGSSAREETARAQRQADHDIEKAKKERKRKTSDCKKKNKAEISQMAKSALRELGEYD